MESLYFSIGKRGENTKFYPSHSGDNRIGVETSTVAEELGGLQKDGKGNMLLQKIHQEEKEVFLCVTVSEVHRDWPFPAGWALGLSGLEEVKDL